MELQRSNYLNFNALIEAERSGRLDEQLELQRSTRNSGVSAESYCIELLKMNTNDQVPGLSATDVIRKEFHTNF